jgi:hypothetical protein
LTPFCAPVNHFGRAEPTSEHLAVDFCAISGSDESLAPFFGLIDGILNRHVSVIF